MPTRYCEGKCKQRHNAGRKTFHDNDYDYGKIQSQCYICVHQFCHTVFTAAHIELLAIVNSSTCTAVNAHIIQCWEIKDNTCPPVNTSLTIPTCAGCPILRPLNVGDRYLIAGVRHKRSGIRRIILPSKKKEGLFGHWNDQKYTDIANWIQRGNVTP